MPNLKQEKPDIREDIAPIIRDIIHSADPNDREILDKYVFLFLNDHEGLKNKAYLDSKNNITVGIGFNMQARGARAEWEQVFGGSVSFDKVMQGELDLTDEQVEKLAKFSINTRINKLETTHYQAIWSKMPINEKTAIISLFFNAETLANDKTKLCQYMHNYYKTGNKHCLVEAVTEVRDRSNKHHEKGVQMRRNCEAAMLSSMDAPLYAGPGLKPCLSKLKLELSRNPFATRLPVNIAKYFSGQSMHPDFFIWRTELDQRVRPEHIRKEGLIFQKNLLAPNSRPGAAYNCRCYEEPVPASLIFGIIQKQLISKDFHPQLRYK